MNGIRAATRIVGPKVFEAAGKAAVKSPPISQAVNNIGKNYVSNLGKDFSNSFLKGVDIKAGGRDAAVAIRKEIDNGNSSALSLMQTGTKSFIKGSAPGAVALALDVAEKSMSGTPSAIAHTNPDGAAMFAKLNSSSPNQKFPSIFNKPPT